MDQLTEREITAFVGENAGYYLRMWRARLAGTETDTGFNWAAFFLGGIWLVYRKLYGAAAFFFGIVVLESVVEVSLNLPRAAWYLGTLVVSLIFGTCGNRWYFTRAEKTVSRVRTLGLAPDAELAALARLGRTNSVAAWTVYFSILVLVFLLADIRFLSVVGIGVGAPSVLLCAVWFLAPSGRRERICLVAGIGSVLVGGGLVLADVVSASLRNRQAAQTEATQKQEAVQATLRQQEALAHSAELGRERDAHWKQALALGAQGRPAEALEEWERALALHRQRAGESTEGDAGRSLRQGRALALAQAGEHVRATAEAAELATATPITGEVLFELARVYSLSAGAARAQQANPEQTQGALRYDGRAVELLARAQRADFFRTPANLDRLLSDRGLDPLRTLPAFNQLLKSRELGRLVAERCLERATNLGQEGQRQLALLWFARGLDTAPADAIDLARACRANIAAWLRPESLLLAQLPHPGKVWAVGFTDAGKTLVSICGVPPEDRSKVQLCVRLWDVETKKETAQHLVPATVVQEVALSADGTTFTIHNNEDRFQFWDSRTGASIGKPVAKTSGRNYGHISLSRDGKLLFAQGVIWEVATGQPVKLNALTEAFYHPLASSADAKTLVAYVGNYQFARLRTATGARIGAALRHEGTGGFKDVAALSNDDARLMTAGETILVWQVATGQPIGPAIPSRNLRTLAFSPNGAAVVTGGSLVPGYDKTAYLSSGSAQLWDAGAGKPTGPSLAHRGWVSAAAFSPDGSRLLTGSHDKSIRLWRVPPPVMGDAEHLVLWVQLETDSALDEHAEACRLDKDGRDRRRKRLQELGGPPRFQ